MFTRGAAEEDDVDERSRVLTATVLGAIAGGAWGWLYLTENGRRVRSQIEPKLENFMRELHSARGTVEKARTAVAEGRRAFDDVAAAGVPGRWSA